jgi:hypothetical protein
MGRKHGGYEKIYTLLLNKRKNDERLNVSELASASGLKIASVRVYIRNRLKNEYIKRHEGDEYNVLKKIETITKEDFVQWMSQNTVAIPKNKSQWSGLIENANQSMLAAIEIHNKPLFDYRYQVVTILVINAWELALKAYISKHNPHVHLVLKDGSTKQFPECLRHVAGELGKNMPEMKDNLEVVYNYRCKYTHFYAEAIDVIVFGLIQKSIHLLSPRWV